MKKAHFGALKRPKKKHGSNCWSDSVRCEKYTRLSEESKTVSSAEFETVWRGRGRSRCPHAVVGGVAQVFHDLLVELRLVLVAEVEEGEGRQTGGR